MKGTPQIEDGYTRIANELLEALAGAKLNGSELKVLLAIIRMTYGYQVKTNKVTVRQLANITDLSTRGIEGTLATLANRKIIIRDRSKTQINKRYKEWKTEQPFPNNSSPNNSSVFTPNNSSGYTEQSFGVSFQYNKKNEERKEKKAADAANSQIFPPPGFEIYEEDYNEILPF